MSGHGRLVALSLGQLVSWGVLYYGVIVAGSRIAEQTGWPLALVTGLFSLGLVVSALAGIPIGRLLDARGPRSVMTAGSALAAAGFVVVALAPTPAIFALGWVVTGAAQSAVLYQAAFTVVTRRYGERRRGALTVVTIAGGLASTVFAPLIAGLLTVLDWRGTFLVLAGILAVVTIPIHALALERSWPSRTPLTPQSLHESSPGGPVRAVLRTRRFWILELATLAVSGSILVVTLAAIPLFMERGLSFELAALGIGLLGAGQLIGRLIFLAAPRLPVARSGPPWRALAATGGLGAVALTLLGVLPSSAWLLIGAGVLAGAVRGAQTLVVASSVPDRWGTRHYGALHGVFAAPVTMVGALAPVIGVVVAQGLGSFAAMALVMAGIALLGAIVARTS
ncbi:MAG: MFS transporter [Microcella sp.]|uniref:MFS transporter n=1 Tax=Microcella sp. TaxID=1913979 RepID=UPI002722654D|nr:MFS transporter [Microcella sp.]MDO8337713.1 MFS transporter [Microcella sp.]